MEETMKMSRLQEQKKDASLSAYQKLALVSILHFVIMYMVMYTMVFSINEIYLNINNVYMTGMMLAPMIIIMPLAMANMYPNKKLNFSIYIISAILLIAFYIGMRAQVFVGDKQFIKSMIPHHSGAVLMCEQSKITDPELKNLCSNIIKAQIEEIKQMENILSRLE